MLIDEPRIGGAARDFLNARHQLLIGGDWVDAQSGKTFETVDPGTGRVIASVPEGDAADIDAAVAAARRAFDGGAWPKMTPSARGRLLWALADLIEANADELADLESLDNGKPRAAARTGDIASCAELLRYTAGWATKLTGETIPLSAPGSYHAYTLREPVGVVGQIIPWNGPLLMAIWKLAPALATGCTVVLKPAEQTPLTALRLGKLLEQLDLPPGVVNIVTGFGRGAGAALAAHPDVDKVAFTGSGATGRQILQAAAGNFKKVSLELGGKSPVIVFPDADISKAIPGVARAIFGNAGQVCAAGSRLYAHRNIFDRLIEGVVDYAETLKVGHGLDIDSQMGPLISQAQLDRVCGFIDQGRSDGAAIAAGGRRHGNEGFFIEPTVIVDARPEMSIVKEEIFGPVLSAMRFDDDELERIAAEANNTIYGLAGSIWTRDISTGHRLAGMIRAGTVGINTHGSIDPALPFGGYRQSGWGREKGREMLDLYTQTKTVLVSL